MKRAKQIAQTHTSLLSSIATKIKQVFDIVKKPIDLLDDLWPGLKSAFSLVLPQKYINLIASIGPYIVGGAGTVVHLGEGMDNTKVAIKACLDKKKPQRKTRIVTGFLASAFAGTGMGLSASLLAGAAGAAVAGQIFMPSIMTGLLTGIYALVLARKSYSLKVTKEKELLAKEKLAKKQQKIELLDKETLRVLKKRIKSLKEQRKKLEEQINVQINDNSKDIKSLQKELKECKQIRKNELRLYQYNKWHEKRLVAERKVAYSALEFSLTAVMLVGTILLTSAIIASGTLSFGIVPVVLSLGGAIVASSCKLFEYIDSKHDYTISGTIRSWAINVWQHLFTRSENKNTKSNSTLPLLQFFQSKEKKPQLIVDLPKTNVKEVNLSKKQIDEMVRHKEYIPSRFFSGGEKQNKQPKSFLQKAIHNGPTLNHSR